MGEGEEMCKKLPKTDSPSVRKCKAKYIPGKSTGLEFKRTRLWPLTGHLMLIKTLRLSKPQFFEL